MRIKGLVEVEGVRLQVDIEAPDQSQEVYVTNIHPHCLVVPKERWWVEYLGLSSSALAELRQLNVRHLGHLTNGEWKLVHTGLSDSTAREVSASLERLRAMALVFEQSSAREIAAELAGFPIPELVPGQAETAPEATAAGPGVTKDKVLPLDTSIREVPGLPEKIQDFLWVIHRARTIGEVIRLGTGRLIMTSAVTAHDVARTEAAFAAVGRPLTRKGEEVKNGET